MDNTSLPQVKETLLERRERIRILRRIDILKRLRIHPNASSSYDAMVYHVEHDSLVRNFPKPVSRKALKKNSRRARAYTRFTEALAERAKQHES